MSLQDIRRFRAAIRVLEREIGRSLKDQSSCCDVTLAQCHLLMELDAQGPHTVSGLAEAMGLDKSTLSRSLDRLAATGLIERVEDSVDRRALNVDLTETGRGAAKRINDECDAIYRDLFKLLPADKHRMVLEAVELLAGAMRSSRDRQECKVGRRRKCDPAALR